LLKWFQEGFFVPGRD